MSTSLVWEGRKWWVIMIKLDLGWHVTSRSDITNLNNKIKKYDENLTYYTSLPKNAGNFKTFITSEVIQKSIIYKTPIQYPNLQISKTLFTKFIKTIMIKLQ